MPDQKSPEPTQSTPANPENLNGNIPHPADQQSPGSIDDIVSSVLQSGSNPATAFGSGEIQDTPVMPPQQIGDVPTDQHVPPVPELPSSSFQKDLEDLTKDIDEARLPEDVKPASISSFEGLKARYKNKIAGLKQQYEDLQNQHRQTNSQLQESQKFKDAADRNLELTQEIERLKAELATTVSELNTASVYRKKYDLENDPQIKHDYVEPMKLLKSRAQDIIKNHGVEESFFDGLLKTTSEYELNSLIEREGFSELNARSLKDYAYKYSYLQTELDKRSSPDFIEETIQSLRGQSIQKSKQLSENSFQALKAAFSEHVQELNESPYNKEHNVFVHDKVVEQAESNYKKLIKVLGPEYHNQQVFAALAQSSLMAAAYPKIKKMNEHLLALADSLADQIDEQESAPPISQSKEAGSGGNTLLDQLNNIKSVASTSIDDIASSAWSELNKNT